MKRTVASAFLSALVLLTASLTFADDFMPPGWRGDPLTVVAEWDFGSDFTPNPYDIIPDYVNSVGDGIHSLGTAHTHAHTELTEVTWQIDPTDPQDGVAMTGAVSGLIDFFLVNWDDDYMFKHLWIQITYGGQGVPVVSSVVGPNASTNTWTDPTYGQPNGPVIDYDMNHRVEVWILLPNPDREHVYIDIPPFTYVDQVVIDTISTNDVISNEDTTWGEVKSLFR
jgi:hypothetical protein